MSYASATKEQLRAWKAASGGDEGRILENVQLKIEKSKVDVQASLIATDGYYLIRRDIDAEMGAKTHQMNIPRKAMQAAEKSMGKNDRAYFEDGRITVRTGTPEMFADLDSPVKIIIPFTEQTAMNFPDTKTLLERGADSPFPQKTIKVDPKLLRELLDQFKSDGHVPEVSLDIRGANEVLLIRTSSTMDGNDIVGGIMPIKSDEGVKR